MLVVHLDWETISDVDPKATSFDLLAKNCKPDLLTWGTAPDFYTMPVEVHCWDARAEPTPPAELLALLNNPANWFVSFNSGFDSIVTQTIFGVFFPNNWLDAGVAASRVGFSVSKLEDLAKVMGCTHQKIELFPGLMKLFSGTKLYGTAKSYRGRALYNKDGSVDQEYYTELRNYYKEYGIKDTWTSAEIFVKSMAEYSESYPVADWLLHQNMNRNGIGVDLTFVDKMITINAALKEDAKNQLRSLCAVSYEVASHPGFTRWLAEQLPGWDKGSAGDVILPLAAEREQEFGEQDVIAIACRLKASALGTADAKWKALKKATNPDGRYYSTLRFNGAAQTGRPSGSGAQMLNLARPYSPKGTQFVMKTSDDAYKAADMPVLEWIDRYGYKASDVAAKIIRSAFVPNQGCKYIDFDFSGIESNAIVCMTQDPAGMEIRRNKLDGYVAFGTKLFGVPYEDIIADKKAGGTMRQVAKVPVLGCFAAGTNVLTNNGHKPIEEVQLCDKVWNGYTFCKHEGVVDQGVKEVIDYDGITVTPDHLFLVNDRWIPVCDLILSQQDHSSIAGQHWANTALKESDVWKRCSAAVVALNGKMQLMLRQANRKGVTPAGLQEKLISDVLSFLKLLDRAFMHRLEIASMPSAVDVKTQTTVSTGITEVGASSASLKMRSRLLDMLSTNWGLEGRGIWSLIALITTEIMRQEIYNWQQELSNAETPGETNLMFGIKASDTHKLHSVLNSLTFLIQNPLNVDWLKACQQKKSLPILNLKPEVAIRKVRTYDLLNVENGNRYAVKGITQTHIVHNCGYQMSGAKLNVYAQGMGIYKDTEFWLKAVKVWRETHHGITQAWDTLALLFQMAVEAQPGTTIPLSWKLPQFPSVLERHTNAVVLRHPCGRGIWFRNPRMAWRRVPYVDQTTGQDAWFDVYSMTFDANMSKKAYRESGYGGKYLAILTQSLCNSLLRDWMRNIDEAGIPIVLQVYDQVLAEVPVNNVDWAADTIAKAVPGIKDPSHWSASWDVGIDGGVLDRFWK